MTFLTRTGTPLPAAIHASAEAAKRDPVNRREFLALQRLWGHGDHRLCDDRHGSARTCGRA